MSPPGGSNGELQSAPARIRSPLGRRGAQWLGRLAQGCRIGWYRLLSTGRAIDHGARIVQPVLITGRGEVILGRCQLGVSPSPHLFSGYIHLEAREASAQITIDDGVCINNLMTVIAERSSVTIGAGSLIGVGVSIYDSDFHDLDPSRRTAGTHTTAPVSIGRNVFIGSHVQVLKGVRIGDNAVIASGSVVTKDIPSGSVAAGVPCRPIGNVPGLSSG